MTIYTNYSNFPVEIATRYLYIYFLFRIFSYNIFLFSWSINHNKIHMNQKKSNKIRYALKFILIVYGYYHIFHKYLEHLCLKFSEINDEHKGFVFKVHINFIYLLKAAMYI